MSQRLLVFLGSALALLLVALPALAGEANLDPGFGSYGTVDNAPANVFAHDVLLQPDGKLVIAAGVGAPSRIGAVRYNADGSIDTGFGSGGVALGVAGEFGVGMGGTVQSDGKIVVVGFTTPSGGDQQWALVRFDTDGTLDSTFGVNGAVLLNPSPAREELGAVVQLASGKLLAVGRMGTNQMMVVARFDTDGSLDATFGNAGIANAGADAYGLYYALVLQPDDKILVASGGEEVARLDPDGSLDQTFGPLANGVVHLDHSVLAILIQPDAKLIAGGGFTQEIEVTRLNGDGSVDASFGDNGAIDTYEFGGTRRMILQPDGSFVATTDRPVDVDGVGLVRFDANGVLDPTFGAGGSVHVPFVDYSSVSPVGLVQQPDGKFVEAGYLNGTLHDGPLGVVLARFGSSTCGNGVVDAGEQCDDGNLASLDCCSNGCGIGRCGRCGTCNAQLECVESTPASCLATAKHGAKLTIKDTAGTDLLTWKISRGGATTLEALGDPINRAEYDFCVFDESGPTPLVRYERRLHAGVGWRPRGTKAYTFFGFVDNSLGENGTLTGAIASGSRTKVNVTAKGTGVSPPALPLGLPLRVQLRSQDGACFDSSFSKARPNVPGKLSATSD